MTADDIPRPLPFERRVKSIEPMPGGQTAYLESLRQVCNRVDKQSMSRAKLSDWLSERFGIGVSYARNVESFLRRTGFLDERLGVLRLSEATRAWLASGDDRIPVSVLHGRIRFVGDMLAELRQPKSTRQLLQAALRHGLSHKDGNAISYRRGWLQSAGLVKRAAGGRWEITAAGATLLERLDLYEAESPAPRDDRSNRHSPAGDSSLPDRIDQIAGELERAATDSANPTRFEKAVAEAFRFLGFIAEHLGGSGNTDVLVTAPLGKGRSYRVAVDAKSASSGSLVEGNVSWPTLKEHRTKHDVDYSTLVAPHPGGKRIQDRAAEYRVAVLSSEQLAHLCRQHARAPLGLIDYQDAFRRPGRADLSVIEGKARHLARLRKLVAAVSGFLEDQAPRVGPMKANQLLVLVPDDEPSEDEIQGILDMLAHPLIGAVQGSRDDGYVLATTREALHRPLELLGDELTTTPSEPD